MPYSATSCLSQMTDVNDTSDTMYNNPRRAWQPSTWTPGTSRYDTPGRRLARSCSMFNKDLEEHPLLRDLQNSKTLQSSLRTVGKAATWVLDSNANVIIPEVIVCSEEDSTKCQSEASQSIAQLTDVFLAGAAKVAEHTLNWEAKKARNSSGVQSGADKEASLTQEGHSACFTDLALTLANMEDSLNKTKKGLKKVINCLSGKGEATVAITR